MAWPWLAIIAKSVPWAELVRRTPEIIAASGRLLDKARVGDQVKADTTPAIVTVDELSRRVEMLEARDKEHAAIIAQMVEQLRGLTDALQVIAARNRFLLLFVVVLALSFVGALLSFI